MANFMAQCVHISTKHNECLVGSNAGDEIAVVVASALPRVLADRF
jgi:hypothetical protein